MMIRSVVILEVPATSKIQSKLYFYLLRNWRCLNASYLDLSQWSSFIFSPGSKYNPRPLIFFFAARDIAQCRAE